MYAAAQWDTEGQRDAEDGPAATGIGLRPTGAAAGSARADWRRAASARAPSPRPPPPRSGGGGEFERASAGTGPRPRGPLPTPPPANCAGRGGNGNGNGARCAGAPPPAPPRTNYVRRGENSPALRLSSARGAVQVSGGTARRSARHERARVAGNGRGIEVRQGAIRVFWGGMRIAWMTSEAQRSKRFRPPAAQSFDPSATSTTKGAAQLPNARLFPSSGARPCKREHMAETRS
jgi:hypothetical protein